VTVYDLYLESGPRKRKTMVHVLDLLGCVAVGPTTEEALAAAPEAIRAYRRFLYRHGEQIEPDEPFETRVAEHITEGYFLGNGSPSVIFAPDMDPLTDTEIEQLLGRIGAFSQELGSWAATQTDNALAARPVGGGRPAREILRHTLAARGGYLSAALGSAPGMGRIATAAERGEIPLAAAFAESAATVVAIVRATTPEQRAAARQLPSGPRTLRQALRRVLEHDWEHLAELSRRSSKPIADSR
jgi:predicted RNase H-like HicB family nuclease